MREEIVALLSESVNTIVLIEGKKRSVHSKSKARPALVRLSQLGTIFSKQGKY